MLGYQLDDEPNLYIGNGLFNQPNIHLKMVGFGVPGKNIYRKKPAQEPSPRWTVAWKIFIQGNLPTSRPVDRSMRLPSWVFPATKKMGPNEHPLNFTTKIRFVCAIGQVKILLRPVETICAKDGTAFDASSFLAAHLSSANKTHLS